MEDCCIWGVLKCRNVSIQQFFIFGIDKVIILHTAERMCMSVSACLITWNEEEMLPYCLKFLNSLDAVDEICVIDSYSTDRTWDILQTFRQQTNKGLVLGRRQFNTFSRQRNECMDMAGGDWILSIDADETFTQDLGGLLKALPDIPSVNAIRIPTLYMIHDRKHYIEPVNTDPHIRIWRRRFARFYRDVHEVLRDDCDRDLHCCCDADVLTVGTTSAPYDVWMKHYQYLKSDSNLILKGLRWDKLGFIEESAKNGIPVYPMFWHATKYKATQSQSILELPRQWYDITTDDPFPLTTNEESHVTPGITSTLGSKCL